SRWSMRTAVLVTISEPIRAAAAMTAMPAASWVEVRRPSQARRRRKRKATAASVRPAGQVAEDEALAARRDDQRMQVLAQFGRLLLQPAAQGADPGVDDVDEIVWQESPLDPAPVPQHRLGHRLAARGHQLADDGEFERRQVDQ